MVSLTVRSLPPLYAFNTMCLVFQGVFYLWKKLPKHDVMWSLLQHSNCKITWFKASRQPSRLLYFTGYWRDHIESSYIWLQCFPPPSWYWDIILFFFFGIIIEPPTPSCLLYQEEKCSWYSPRLTSLGVFWIPGLSFLPVWSCSFYYQCNNNYC